MIPSVTRQTPGGTGRQKLDALGSHSEVDWHGGFLESNLQHLSIGALTRDAVRTASTNAELGTLPDGQSVLRHAGRPLDHALEEGELRRVAHNTECVFIVFGLGLGNTARALRALTDAPIVVFEPDPGILRAVLELGPSDLSPFEIFSSSHDLTQAWPTLFSGKRSAVLVTTTGYHDGFADAAAHLRETVAQLVQRSGVNDATHRLRAREWISDLLENVELLSEHPGFLALAGKYRGVPAFIVGAGPSLGKNGHLLLQAQGKGIVFAVNSSARALRRYGAEPHVLACIESIDVSHLLADTGIVDRAVRAFSLTAHPRTVRTGKGPLLPLYEGLPQISAPLQRLTGFPGLPVSGSVSTLAFSLAQRLGCSPIVFVGQDLAYTDGRAYAPGSPYEDSRVEVSSDGREINLNWCDTLKHTHNVGGRRMHEREPLAETTAWGGSGQVVTGIAFSAVRAWLETAATVLAREAPGTRLVNATEGGARIHGFDEERLEDVLRGLPDCNISPGGIARDAAAAAAPIPRAKLVQWLRSEATLVDAVRHRARRVRRLSELSLSSAKRADLDVAKRLRRLEGAERELRNAVAGAPLLDAWSWSAVDALMAEREPDEGSDPKRSAELALAFEARLGATIEQSAQELATELLKLSSRLQAESPVR